MSLAAMKTMNKEDKGNEGNEAAPTISLQMEEATSLW